MNNRFGYTLIEVIIPTFISSLIFLAVASILADSFRRDKRLREDYEIIELNHMIYQALEKPGQCVETLGSLTMNGIDNTGEEFAIDTVKDADGNPLFETYGKSAKSYGRVRIDSLKIENFRFSGFDQNERYKGSADVELAYTTNTFDWQTPIRKKRFKISVVFHRGTSAGGPDADADEKKIFDCGTAPVTTSSGDLECVAGRVEYGATGSIVESGVNLINSTETYSYNDVFTNWTTGGAGGSMGIGCQPGWIPTACAWGSSGNVMTATDDYDFFYENNGCAHRRSLTYSGVVVQTNCCRIN